MVQKIHSFSKSPSVQKIFHAFHLLWLLVLIRVTLEVLWCVMVCCMVLYPGVTAVLNLIILVSTLKCVPCCHGSMRFLTAISPPDNHTSHLREACTEIILFNIWTKITIETWIRTNKYACRIRITAQKAIHFWNSCACPWNCKCIFINKQ